MVSLGTIVATLSLVSGSLPVVVIDPGHGGLHPGAHGVCGAIEKDVVLDISKIVVQLLAESKRVHPQATRLDDRDIPLEERAQFANRLNAAVFVSIHANASFNRDAHGVETFFLSRKGANKRLQNLAWRENGGRLPDDSGDEGTLANILGGLSFEAAHAASQRLALKLQGHLADKVKSRKRGVLQAPFLVLLKSNTAAALVEVGFITHAEECKALLSVSHQTQIAKALTSGILMHVATETPLLAKR